MKAKEDRHWSCAIRKDRPMQRKGKFSFHIIITRSSDLPC